MWQTRTSFSMFNLFWVLLLLVGCQTANTPVPPTEIVSDLPATQVDATPVTTPTGTPSPTKTLPTPTPISPTLTPAITPTAQTHIVSAGETLIKIAVQHGLSLEVLLSANNLTIDAIVYPGDELLIPAPPTAIPLTATETVNVSNDGNIQASTYITHTVSAGESYAYIASLYGVTESVLRSANPNTDAFFPGEVLQIPLSEQKIHVIQAGETHLGIALDYGVDLGALIELNLRLGNFRDPDVIDLIYPGDVLAIPDPFGTPPDCAPGSTERTAVIEHPLRNGQNLFCLATKYDISYSLILDSNDFVDWSAEGMIVFIPPNNDTRLYIVKEPETRTYLDPNGIEAKITVETLRDWYGVVSNSDMTDWQGNSINQNEPLQVGQRLMFRSSVDNTFDAQFVKDFYGWTLVDATPVNNNQQLGGQQPPASEDPSVENESANLVDSSSNDNDTQVDNNVQVLDGSIEFPSYTGRLWTQKSSLSHPGYCAYQNGSGWSDSLIWPVDTRELHSQRQFSFGHPAIDIMSDKGDSVYASASGTVIWSGLSYFIGGYIVALSHGNQWRTYYAHLDEIYVNCGDIVQQGQQIGISGDTGTSFPHLHFSVEQGATTHDPLNWLGR